MDNGGPAFPLDLKVEDNHYWAHGMNLRDYFAAKAMQGMQAHTSTMSDDLVAKYAYDVADAMLAERLKDKQ